MQADLTIPGTSGVGGLLPLRLVVCGTGRCGTTTLARALTDLGIPCGHENCFTVMGILHPPGLEAEASWLAAPYLLGLACPILHLVRHPLEVLNSMEGIRFLDGGITENNWLYEQYARRFVPELDGLADSRERHMRFIISWNRRIEARAVRRVRLEECNHRLMGTLLAELGLRPPLADRAEGPEILAKENSRPRSALSLMDLPRGALRDEFVAHGQAYGYRF
jgi:hypothetical protein